MTRMMSDRVMMNVFSVLKSRTSTAGFSGVIIVDSRTTGVEGVDGFVGREYRDPHCGKCLECRGLPGRD